MGITKFWSVKYFDSGAGSGTGNWVSDIQIPRGGINPFTRTKESTISFFTLADGSEAKSSNETASNWKDVILTFPKQVITEAVKTQLQGYIDNEQGIQIIMPMTTGASSYTEKVIKGYITKYDEKWELDSRENIRYTVYLTLHEFNIDGV